MTQAESRLVGYLSWVDDEDFRRPELDFLQRLLANPDTILLPLESRLLSRLHVTRGY